MRYVVLTSIIIVTLFCLEALAEEKKVVAGTNTALSRFFDPIPKPELEIKGVQDNTRSEWRPVVAIPALKLIESTRENAQLDALVLTQVGGGVSYQKLEYDSENKKWVCKWSISPMTVLLSANTANDNPIDISYAATVGLFDNLIMVGVGWDFGDVGDRSRLFGLLSMGINFNN